MSHAIVDGIDGTDQLCNIERLQFSDGSYAMMMGTLFKDNVLCERRPVLNGTTNNEIIIGLAGGDILNGNGGNDVLIGGTDGLLDLCRRSHGHRPIPATTATPPSTGGWTRQGDVTGGQPRHGGQDPHPERRPSATTTVPGREQHPAPT